MTDWQNRIVGLNKVPVNQLHAHELNARRHPAPQREALRGSLDTLGIVAPPIRNIRTNTILDGHARVEEYLTRDENMEIHVLDVDLAEHEEALFLASFDYITQLATYDRDALDTLLKEVQTDDTRLQAMLSEMAEANDLYFGDEQAASAGKAPDAQTDRAAELQAIWQVTHGQVWRIGNHKLMCGDSTSPEDVARLMDGLKADAVVTDPPYNIVGTTTGADDGSGINVIEPFFRLFIQNIGNTLKPHGHAYICCDFRTYPLIYRLMNDASLHMKNCIVWHKSEGGGLGSFYQNSYELLAFAALHNRARVAKQDTGARTVTGVSNVWKIPPATYGNDAFAKIPHAAQKPVDLFKKCIENSTDADNTVLDLFCGSGTTLAACEELHRQGRGMEISEAYCSVVLQRLKDMGQSPELDTTR